MRNFPLRPGHGFADYLLYVDGAAAGVVEAKKEGATLTGFEVQTVKYSEGLPDELKAYRRPLPFCYQSTGIETRKKKSGRELEGRTWDQMPTVPSPFAL
ncbi:MAG: hypothetical protein ACLQOO_29475 [Terriglobia bacterium]